MTEWSYSAPAPAAYVAPVGEPSFSVLVAAYQAAAVVGEAIGSLLAQTRPPKEIIVCDDGSTDDLESSLAPYRDHVIFVRQQNRGVAAARNRAAREATGDFLAVLDADDVYLPRRVEAMAWLAARRPDLDIVTTNELLEVGGRVVGRTYQQQKPFVVDRQELAILDHAFLWHPAVRRSRYEEVGGFDETLAAGEDWDLWARLIVTGSRAGTVDEPLAVYRLRAGGLTSDTVGTLRGRVQVLRKQLARPDLTPRQRDVAGRSHARRVAELELAEARDALRHRAPDARELARRIASDPSFRLPSRAKAALAVLSPAVGRAALRVSELPGRVTVHGARIRPAA